MPAGRRRETAATSVPPLGGLGVKPGAVTETLSGTPDPLRARCAGGDGDGDVPGSVQLHGAADQAVRRETRTRLPVPTARRRMLPSQPISVITTLTVASVPAPARQRASYPAAA